MVATRFATALATLVVPDLAGCISASRAADDSPNDRLDLATRLLGSPLRQPTRRAA